MMSTDVQDQSHRAAAMYIYVIHVSRQIEFHQIVLWLSIILVAVTNATI